MWVSLSTSHTAGQLLFFFFQTLNFFFLFSKLICILLLTLQNFFNLFTLGTLEASIPAGWRSEVCAPCSCQDVCGTHTDQCRKQRDAQDSCSRDTPWLLRCFTNNHRLHRAAQSNQWLSTTFSASGDQRGVARTPCQQIPLIYSASQGKKWVFSKWFYILSLTSHRLCILDQRSYPALRNTDTNLYLSSKSTPDAEGPRRAWAGPCFLVGPAHLPCPGAGLSIHVSG